MASHGYFLNGAHDFAENIFLTPTRVARPESEKAWYESAQKYSVADGIAAYEWGPEKGPLVVLVHGWSGRGTQMAAFAELSCGQRFSRDCFRRPSSWKF